VVARTINRLLAPIARRVRLMARRAVVRLVYDDPKMQELQLAIFAGEIRDKVERWQDYGITSHPHPGAEALVLALGGNTDHGAVIRVDDRRYRLVGLAQGEVALYDDQGQVLHLMRDNTLHVYGTDHLVADVGADAVITCPEVTVAASTQVTLNTPLVQCSTDMTVGGNLSVTGNGSFGGGLTMTGASGSGNISTPGAIAANGDVSDGTRSMATDRAIYNAHTHPGDSGGTTGTPNQSM